MNNEDTVNSKNSPLGQHDQQIKAAMASVEPPAWLKDSILEQAQPTQAKILRPTFKILSIAALLTVGIFTAFIVFNMKTNNQLASNSDFRDAAASYIVNGKFLLDYKAQSLDDISSWLALHNAPNFGELPQNLKDQQPIGCKELTWRKQTITLVCFHLTDGQIVHMFIGNRNPTTEGMFANLTETARVQQLETGGWTTEDQIYLLTGSDASVRILKYMDRNEATRI